MQAAIHWCDSSHLISALHSRTLSFMRYAPFHQHFFCARLESSVDGMNNTVLEVNTRGVEGAANPHHSAYTIEQTLLRRESEAQRTVNASESRFWRIINPPKLNSLGRPTAYRVKAVRRLQVLKPHFSSGQLFSRRISG